MKCTIKFIKTIISVLLVGVVLISAIGCNNETAENKGTPAPTVTPTAKPKSGGTVRIPMPQKLSVFDPLKMDYDMMRNVYGIVYENFMELDAEKKVVLNIANSMKYDKATKSWEFYIRRGIKWHGTETEVNAYDVEYTMQRIMAENTPYTRTLKNAVKSFEVLDLYRIKITAIDEGIMTLYALNFPVISKEYNATELKNGEMPKGTGAYRLDNIKDENGRKKLELVINDKWWKKKPNISKVICVGVQDERDAIKLVGDGTLDAVNMPYSHVGWYNAFGECNVYDYMTSDYEYLIPNMKNGLLADINIRKAIACGINTREVVSKAYGNHGVSSDLPIIPDSWLSTITDINYDYDSDKAASILAKNGWADKDGDGVLEKKINGAVKKLSFKIIVNTSETNKNRHNSARFIAEDLKKIGINVEVVPLEWKEYSKRLSEGNYDAALVGSRLGTVPDLTDFFKSLKNGGYNYTEEIKLINKAKAEQDEEKWMELNIQLQNMLLEKVPFIGLYFHTNSIVYSKTLQVDLQVIEGDAFRTIDKWYFK